MFRTVIAIVRFFWCLIKKIPKMRQALAFDRKGMIAERDAVVHEQVTHWARFVLALAGGEVEVVGEEKIPQDTAVVFVGNHQSYFDIPILLGFISKPKAFISKIEILKVPFLSVWMRLMQCTFLDRKNMRQSIEAMNEAAKTVQKGYSLVIFPEGTRSKGKGFGSFKAGSFKLALKTGVPIVPVTIDGSWRLFEEKCHVARATVRLTIHDPVPTANLSREESQELPALIQSRVQSALQ